MRKVLNYLGYMCRNTISDSCSRYMLNLKEISRQVSGQLCHFLFPAAIHAGISFSVSHCHFFFGFYFLLCLWLFKFPQHHSPIIKKKPTELYCTHRSHRSLKLAVYQVYNLFALCSSLFPYTVRFPVLFLGLLPGQLGVPAYYLVFVDPRVFLQVPPLA